MPMLLIGLYFGTVILAASALAWLSGRGRPPGIAAKTPEAVRLLMTDRQKKAVFVLAVFVGYHVVWRVTPALHSPPMAVTNAISSVIIVGALIAAGPADFSFSEVMGFLAVVLASVTIFGGFIVTQRMLSMFKKKK